MSAESSASFEIETSLRRMEFLDICANYNIHQIRSQMERGSQDLELEDHDIRALIMNMPLHYLREFKGSKLKNKVLFEFIPSDYSLEEINYKEFLKSYISKFDQVMLNGYSIYFYGDNSRGKTHSALYIAYLLSKRLDDFTFYYTNTKDFYLKYREAFFSGREDSEETRTFIEAVRSCDLLILDEFGKEGNLTDTLLSSFEELIRLRSSMNYPTIICGNIRPHPREEDREIEEGTSIHGKYGQSIYSAMLEKFRFLMYSSKQNKNLREDNCRRWSLE